jgi:hypothetical protein
MNVNEIYVENLSFNIYFVYCCLLYLSAKIATASVSQRYTRFMN